MSEAVRSARVVKMRKPSKDLNLYRRYKRSREASPRIWRFGFACVSIGAMLIFWTIASGTLINETILPPPAEVISTTWTMIRNGELMDHVAASSFRIGIGYINGTFWAIILGAIAGRILVARDLMMPLMNLIRPISPTALVPLMIIWFGIGEMSKIALVGYTTFITVFFSTMSGVADVPPTRERAAKTLGASDLDVFRLVVFPSAIPFILTGMRIGLGLAFMSVVAAELIAADKGIGFLIMQSRFSMLTERMFVGLLCLAVIGLIIDWIFRALIRKFGGPYVGKQLTEAF